MDAKTRNPKLGSLDPSKETFILPIGFSGVALSTFSFQKQFRENLKQEVIREVKDELSRELYEALYEKLHQELIHEWEMVPAIAGNVPYRNTDRG